MTGAYLRTKRRDKWENIEVEHLTDAERTEAFAHRTPEELVRWMNLLSAKLADCELVLDGLVTDGVLLRKGDETTAGA